MQRYVKNFWQDMLVFVIAPLLFYHILPDGEGYYTNIITFLLSSLRLLCTWYPEFHVGLLIAKYSIDERVYHCIKKRVDRRLIVWICLIAMFSAVLLRTLYRDFALAFIFVIAFDCFVKSVRFDVIHSGLSFLGKYSFQYWLQISHKQ